MLVRLTRGRPSPLEYVISMKKTNPNINLIPVPLDYGFFYIRENDLVPCKNLNVRIALQEAINLKQIVNLNTSVAVATHPHFH